MYLNIHIHPKYLSILIEFSKYLLSSYEQNILKCNLDNELYY